MPYPYKKMAEEDLAYIRSVTSEDRVWVGDEIAREFYRDEMPEYGVFPPELYVEVENRDEVSAIMKYAYENISPWYAAARAPALPAARPPNTAASCFLSCA